MVAALGALITLATIMKVSLAATTYGTTDIAFWERFLREANTGGGLALYRNDPTFNHPPLMISYIQLLGHIADATHVPFRFWLRVVSSAADIGTLCLVVATVKRMNPPVDPRTLGLLAIAPASIMISGFHGNTDPVMIMFVVLGAYLATIGRPPWAIGIAIGMALSVKFAAIVFTPAIFFWLVDWKQRGKLVGTVVVVVALASMPYVIQDPALLAHKIIGYGSVGGEWGVTRLLSAGPSSIYDAYQRFAAIPLLVGIAVMCWSITRRARSISPFLLCGLSGSLFLVFTPGFGVQYLAWEVPWVVVLGLGPSLVFYASTGAFLFSVYTYWSGGFPWGFADALRVGSWVGAARVAEAVSWMSMMAVFVLMARLAAVQPSRRGTALPGPTSPIPAGDVR